MSILRECERTDAYRKDNSSVVGHDSKELLLVDLSVVVEVELVYHRLAEGHREWLDASG